jgi:L,D-peptidoglycan transpeptidase YkuD (ErfK/YbiS/YcfS/YnhG family)
MKVLVLFSLVICLGTPIGLRAEVSQNVFSPYFPDTDSLPAQQLLIVVTQGWDNLQGFLYGYQKTGSQWVLVFQNQVVLGSKGLGIGSGLLTLAIPGAPIKKEGDLKSPAGVFSIGRAFGYASPKEASWIKNPYIQATDTLICVDDIHSDHYNTLVGNDPAKSDWKSFEYMHRKDNFYQWGLFINHNAPGPVSGAGSCIFMHIWENEHVGTDGCTAMREEDMVRVLHWIDAGLNPVLIQLPEIEYFKLAATYQWPRLVPASKSL